MLEDLRKKYEDNPNEETALGYARGLANLSARQSDESARQATVKDLEGLSDRYSDSSEIALQYARGLANLSARQSDESARQATIKDLEGLSDRYSDSSEIALQYARGLARLSTKQSTEPALQATVEVLKDLSARYSDSSEIVLQYAIGLANLSAEQSDESARQATVKDLKGLSDRYSDSAGIALGYAVGLARLSAKQSTEPALQATVEVLKDLSARYLDSSEIALYYAVGLANLSARQSDESARQATVKELKSLSARYSDSSEIALQYARGLANLSVKQSESTQKGTVKKLGELFKRFNLNPHWVLFAKELLRMRIEKNISLADNIPWSQFKPSYVEELLDSICYYKKNEKSIEKEETDRQIEIFWKVIKEARAQLSRTKYASFKELLKNTDADENKSTLFEVYRLTQLLKFKLAIKKFEKNKNVLLVGHYTKRDTLESMIRYREEEKEDDRVDRKIESKSRLYNANYMNDTQEGVLLDKFLELEPSDKLQPSSWYLMSLTNNHDNLSMWSQYGDSGSGVCIVLRNDSFKVLPEIESMDSFTTKKNLEELSSITDESSKIESTKQDELYRICYLKDNKVIESDLFENDDIKELQKNLVKLNKTVGLLKDKKQLLEVVSNFLEEIRYLFKSADYAYESEVRILRYVSESDRDKVKYDLGDKERRLYIERSEPMQIEKIIFGPKFANADFATPYIQWVDKTIQFERSKIHFR